MPRYYKHVIRQQVAVAAGPPPPPQCHISSSAKCVQGQHLLFIMDTADKRRRESDAHDSTIIAPSGVATRIPAEIWAIVATFLSMCATDLANFAQTCRSFRALVGDLIRAPLKLSDKYWQRLMADRTVFPKSVSTWAANMWQISEVCFSATQNATYSTERFKVLLNVLKFYKKLVHVKSMLLAATECNWDDVMYLVAQVPSATHVVASGISDHQSGAPEPHREETFDIVTSLRIGLDVGNHKSTFRICSFRNLEELCITGSWDSISVDRPTGVHPLTALKALVTLAKLSIDVNVGSKRAGHVSDRVVGIIVKSMNRLVSFSIRNSLKFVDMPVMPQTIRELAICGCFLFKSASVENLCKAHPELVALNIAGSGEVGNSLVDIGTLVALRDLKMDISQTVTAAEMASLRHLAALNTLTVQCDDNLVNLPGGDPFEWASRYGPRENLHSLTLVGRGMSLGPECNVLKNIAKSFPKIETLSLESTRTNLNDVDDRTGIVSAVATRMHKLKKLQMYRINENLGSIQRFMHQYAQEHKRARSHPVKVVFPLWGIKGLLD